jgi:hypothetical protein
MNLLGDARDDQVDFGSAVHLNGVLPTVFGERNWGPDAAEGRLKNLWSGCLGFTADAMPFVGRLESSLTGRKVEGLSPNANHDSYSRKAPALDQPGEWISAGYCGEGMVSAWLCSVAVSLMLLGMDEVDIRDPRPGCVQGKVRDWFPEEYLVSKGRVQRATVVELVEWI